MIEYVGMAVVSRGAAHAVFKDVLGKLTRALSCSLFVVWAENHAHLLELLSLNLVLRVGVVVFDSVQYFKISGDAHRGRFDQNKQVKRKIYPRKVI